MNLNSIFGQFSPDYLFLMPMTFVSMLMAISWLFLSNSTNWLPTRAGFSLLSFNRTIIKTIFQQTNPSSVTWAPIIITVFILLFSIKVLGLLPYAFTATSHMSLTYSIGLPMWMSVNMLGFYLSFNARLSHLVPQGTPSYLIPLMVMIETLSLFAQPMALGLRLAANLTAGHLLIYLMSTAIWVLMSNITIASITFIMFVLLFLLEIGVACIQAYVFTALIHFYLVQNL